MARVWNAPLDPRDYRMQEQREQYEGPAFKEMMHKRDPEPKETRRGMQGRQYSPHAHAKKIWYERT